MEKKYIAYQCPQNWAKHRNITRCVTNVEEGLPHVLPKGEAGVAEGSKGQPTGREGQEPKNEPNKDERGSKNVPNREVQETKNAQNREVQELKSAQSREERDPKNVPRDKNKQGDQSDRKGLNDRNTRISQKENSDLTSKLEPKVRRDQEDQRRLDRRKRGKERGKRKGLKPPKADVRTTDQPDRRERVSRELDRDRATAEGKRNGKDKRDGKDK